MRKRKSPKGKKKPLPHAFRKGNGASHGRPKGAVNRVTRDVRQVIKEFAENRAGDFEGWIDRIARKNPAKAADLFLRAIEYHIPKIKEAPPEDPGMAFGERLAGRLATPLAPGEATTLYLAMMRAPAPKALSVTVEGELAEETT